MFIEFIFQNAFLAVTTALLGGATIYLWSNSNSHIALDVHSLILQINNSNAITLDIRPKNEFDNGHLPRSQHVPESEFDDRIDKYISKNRPIMVICKNGMTSTSKVRKLHDKGNKEIQSLKGGIQAWLEAGQPLHKKRK